jgi:hypothetical protein
MDTGERLLMEILYILTDLIDIFVRMVICQNSSRFICKNVFIKLNVNCTSIKLVFEPGVGS